MKNKRNNKNRGNWNLNEIKNLYESGKNTVEIGKIYNKYPTSINRILKKLNVKIKSVSESHKKYFCDENYFESIDNEEKAYFLGLMITDGNNTGNGFQINLQEKDKYILEKFKKSIKYNGKLYLRKRKKYNKNHQDQYCLHITSKKLSDSLTKQEVPLRKTLITKFPLTVPDNLYNHLIRGIIDGDGCITINKKRQPIIYLTGSIELLSKIQDILIEKCGLNKTKFGKNKNHPENIVSLIYGGKLQVIKIRDYLYKDATIYLQRKYDKFYQN